MTSLVFHVSGWCAGGRVWPPSDSCDIRIFKTFPRDFYILPSLSVDPTDPFSLHCGNQSAFRLMGDGNLQPRYP